MGNLTIFFYKFYCYQKHKRKLPGTSTGLTHKKMHEATFDIDKRQVAWYFYRSYAQERHLKQPSTLTRNNKFMLQCYLPLAKERLVLWAHGSGGQISQRLSA